MKTRAALLFAFALLSLGSLAYAADAATAAGTPAVAPVTLPALAGFLAAMSPVSSPANCAGSLSSPAVADSSPAVSELGLGGASPLVVLTCGCGNTLCTGKPVNTSCGTGVRCFMTTVCAGNPKTRQCVCTTMEP